MMGKLGNSLVPILTGNFVFLEGYNIFPTAYPHSTGLLKSTAEEFSEF